MSTALKARLQSEARYLERWKLRNKKLQFTRDNDGKWRAMRDVVARQKAIANILARA